MLLEQLDASGDVLLLRDRQLVPPLLKLLDVIDLERHPLILDSNIAVM